MTRGPVDSARPAGRGLAPAIAGSAPMAATDKRTVLFLAANPRGTEPRALDREAQAIRAELRHSGYRDRFHLETRWAVQPFELLDALCKLRPAVVHFSGQGGPDGLYFEGEDGRAQVVSPEAIAATFGAAGASVQLVVLSACYSEAAAQALIAHVDCVVGMSGALPDRAARAFAIGFYGALGERESVAAAYRHGKAAILLDGRPEAECPQLTVRDGCDASARILADPLLEIAMAPSCPYPGMRPYTADDADHFHGRDTEIEELIGRLRAGERELCVLGPSGSGKSSLIAAGVLPRLARGMTGLGPLFVRSMRPGAQPAARLDELLERSDPAVAPADAVTALLAHRAPGTSVLIVIDQVEELFTPADPGEQARFWWTWRALQDDPRCTILFTLRADFHVAFMESPLGHRRRSYLWVGPLRGAALGEAIVQSARDVGVDLEPGLVTQLLADAGSEPGVLPLLQETLLQLWDRRQGWTLTLADYQALGDGDRSGLAVALARRADAVLHALTQPQEVIARRIMLRLISFGEGRPDTRRQQPRAKLRAAGDDADFHHVLDPLIGARLLTADDDDRGGEACIDLAHEVLIASWPTLAGWIQTHRGEEQRRRQLDAAAAEWMKHGRGLRGLFDAIELAEAEAWQRTESAHELGPSAEVDALVVASRSAQDGQRRRRRRLVRGAFAVLAVFAAVVAALAVMARHRASEAEASGLQAETDKKRAQASELETQRLLAQSYQEVGRQLLVDERPQEAMAYLIAAQQNGAKGEAIRMLTAAASRSLPVIPLLAHRDAVRSAAFSPDGTRVVTASSDGSARVWDAATGEPVGAPLVHHAGVTSAAFSPDGARVVTTSVDGTAQLWDAAAGKPLGTLSHQAPVNGAAFSPDGTRVVTASWDQTAQVWDAATGKPLGAPLAHHGRVKMAAFSPDGLRVVTVSVDKTARVWDVATGKPVGAALAHQAEVTSAAFSPDGLRVVTASVDRTARVWDAATGKPVGAALAHREPVRSAAFSPDGLRVVTASVDQTAQVWDAATSQPLGAPLTHQGWVTSAAFSPDGLRVVTASDDQTARVWDAATGKPLGAALTHQAELTSVAFNRDGTRVVTASDDGTARVWDAASGKPPSAPLKHQAEVTSAAFSPDGLRVVTASHDRTARVWDAATGKPLGAPLAHHAEVTCAAFDPGGTRVVTASADGNAQVWDAATGKPLGTALTHKAAVLSAAFCPDGRCVVTASRDGSVSTWDAATGAGQGTQFTPQVEVTRAVFSLDGTHVVTVNRDGTARVWDAVNGTRPGARSTQLIEVTRAVFNLDGTRVATASRDQAARVWDAVTDLPLIAVLTNQRRVTSAAFSRDGTRVVAVGRDGTARVWDAASGKPLGAPLTHQGAVSSAAFSPDGTRVVAASRDGTAQVWDAATGKPLGAPLTHQAAVTSAAFSPDGTRVITTSVDKTARVWDIPLDDAAWNELAARCPFAVTSGALEPRIPPPP